MLRKSIFVSVLTLGLFALTGSVALAHSCSNVNKKEGAGTQALLNNGGVAGFVERPDGVEVFIHPSVSNHPVLSEDLEGSNGNFTNYPGDPGSLPEGAHNSNGWEHVDFTP